MLQAAWYHSSNSQTHCLWYGSLRAFRILPSTDGPRNERITSPAQETELTFFKRPRFNELLSAWSQTPQLAGDVTFFRNSSFFHTFLKLFGLFTAMSPTLDFFDAFTTTHAITPCLQITRLNFTAAPGQNTPNFQQSF